MKYIEQSDFNDLILKYGYSENILIEHNDSDNYIIIEKSKINELIDKLKEMQE